MLSVQDNEKITQVGPGTPMGALMLQYRIPRAHVVRAAWFGRPDEPMT